ALADDHAGARGEDDDLRLVRGALDLHGRDVRVHEVVLHGALDAHVFVEPLCVALVLEPLAVPRLDDAEAEAVRMNLLTHVIYSRVPRWMVMWLKPFWMRVARPIARGRQRRMCLFGALSTKAVSTNNVSRSTPGLVVRAFATALSMSFFRTG